MTDYSLGKKAIKELVLEALFLRLRTLGSSKNECREVINSIFDDIFDGKVGVGEIANKLDHRPRIIQSLNIKNRPMNPFAPKLEGKELGMIINDFHDEKKIQELSSQIHGLISAINTASNKVDQSIDSNFIASALKDFDTEAIEDFQALILETRSYFTVAILVELLFKLRPFMDMTHAQALTLKKRVKTRLENAGEECPEFVIDDEAFSTLRTFFDSDVEAYHKANSKLFKDKLRETNVKRFELISNTLKVDLEKKINIDHIRSAIYDISKVVTSQSINVGSSGLKPFPSSIEGLESLILNSLDACSTAFGKMQNVLINPKVGTQYCALQNGYQNMDLFLRKIEDELLSLLN